MIPTFSPAYVCLLVLYFLADTSTNKIKIQKQWTASLLPFLNLSHILPPNPPSSPHHRLVFYFTVQPQHCNRLGTLHGGAAGTLFDLCTTLPLVLVSRPGFWQLLGVSRTLNVTYLRPAVVGTRVRIECEIVQVGKRVCTLRGVMRSAEEWEGEAGLVIGLCEHGKMNIDPGASAGKL